MQPQPPSLLAYRQQIDIGHLRLLAVFHYVFAGFALLGIVFLIGHYLILSTVFSNPELMSGGTPMPRDFMSMFVWFYIVFGLICLAGCVLNCLAANFLRSRKNRIFIMVVAGLNCAQMPLGTVLGVFTLMVLSRESVKSLYSEP
jgi:hypothetical protein